MNFKADKHGGENKCVENKRCSITLRFVEILLNIDQVVIVRVVVPREFIKLAVSMEE